MAKRQNIIHAVDILLNDPEFGQNPLMIIYHEINSCREVKKANLVFRAGDLKTYLSWLKEGLLYAEKQWGDECVPGMMNFVTGDRNYMAYDYGENSLKISPLHIVYYCSNAFGALIDSDYFPGFGISVKNTIILLAMEMCYYAHLAKDKNQNMIAFSKTAFGRKKLSKIVVQAIKDLNIRLYRTAPEQFDL